MEQLLYTWAPRGVEGVNRFQIYAASPALKRAGMVGLLSVVRKVCRYDPPRGQGRFPISYGWFDYRDQRIVFCRQATAAGYSRQGNFAAHVLVGRATEAPEQDIALRYGSSTWWAGLAADSRPDQQEPATLEPVDLTAIEMPARGGGCDDQAVDGLARALYEHQPPGQLVILDEQECFGPALRVVAEAYPHVLDGLTLSTYEGAPTVPFHVAGAIPASASLRPQAAHQLGDAPDDLLERKTLVTIRSHGREPGRIGRAAADVAAQYEGGNRRTAFWRTAHGLVAAADEAGLDEARLDDLAQRPACVAVLVHEPRSREHLADALAKGNPHLRHAIRSATTLIAPTDLCALGRRTAELQIARNDLRGCAAVAQALSTTNSKYLEPLLAHASSGPGQDAKINQQDIAVLLTYARQRNIRASRIDPLLERASPALEVLIKQDVADEYIDRMVHHALTNESLRPSAFPAIAHHRPGLLARLHLDSVERDRTRHLLTGLHDAELRASLQELTAPLIDSGIDREALAALLKNLSLSTQALVLREGCRRAPAPVPPEISSLLDEYAARLIRAALQEIHAPAHEYARLPETLLALSSSQDALRARQFLAPIANGATRRGIAATVLKRAAAAQSAITDPRLRDAVADGMIDAAVSSCRDANDAWTLWDAYTRRHPGEAPHTLPRQLFASAARNPDPHASSLILHCLVSAIVPEPKHHLTRKAQLKDPDLQRLARRLAHQAGQRRLRLDAKSLDTLPPVVRDWWTDLSRARHERREPWWNRHSR